MNYELKASRSGKSPIAEIQDLLTQLGMIYFIMKTYNQKQIRTIIKKEAGRNANPSRKSTSKQREKKINQCPKTFLVRQQLGDLSSEDGE